MGNSHQAKRYPFILLKGQNRNGRRAERIGKIGKIGRIRNLGIRLAVTHQALALLFILLKGRIGTEGQQRE